jgi:hypothetical protein
MVKLIGLGAAKAEEIAAVRIDDAAGSLFPVVPPWAAALAAPVANRLLFAKFRVDKERTFSAVRVGIGATAGNGIGAIWQSDGTTLTLLESSGTVAIASTNAIQDFALADDVACQPDIDYYVMSGFDTATTLTVFRQSLTQAGFGSGFAVGYSSDNGSLTLPATITIASMNGASILPVMSLVQA